MYIFPIETEEWKRIYSGIPSSLLKDNKLFRLVDRKAELCRSTMLGHQQPVNICKGYPMNLHPKTIKQVVL